MKLKKDVFFVGVQFLLFVLYLFDFFGTFSIPDLLQWLGLGFTALGVLVVFISLLQLNVDLSPFPTPKHGSQLRTNGVFAIVRHPIYTGILIAVFSYSVFQQSIWKLIVALSLLILFHFKSRYEEVLLSDKFEAYKAYQKRTGRLWPKWK